MTDADVILGRIDPDRFAGGRVKMVPERAYEAVRRKIGQKTNMTDAFSAFGVSEIVDENMASAARVHAIEWGKDISARAMIAFGGAAPLHASRLAEKLDIDKVIIPTGAGDGSAIGFLRAPVAYEVVRSRYLQLETFDPHEPFFTQQKYKDLYPHDYDGPHFDWPPYGTSDRPPDQDEHVRQEYAALVSMCDEYLGKLLDTMDELDMWDDTMLIVNTDHGFLLGEHDWWGKVVQPFYQEIAHTPLSVSYTHQTLPTSDLV